MSRGRLLLLTTPFGRRGTFFDAWESGGGDWERVRAIAAQAGPAARIDALDLLRWPGVIRDGQTGDVAGDHYHRWREDIALTVAEYLESVCGGWQPPPI